MAWSGERWYGQARFGGGWLGMARRDLVGKGRAWQGWRGEVGHGLARAGMDGLGKAGYGTAGEAN